MPPRKRQGKSEKHQDQKNSNINGKSSKGSCPKTGESRPSCVRLVLVLLLLVLLSAGVFVYFVDVNSVIDNVMTRFSGPQYTDTKIPLKDDLDLSTPAPVPSPNPPKQKNVEKEKDVASKTEKPSSKIEETDSKQTDSKQTDSKQTDTKQTDSKPSETDSPVSQETTKKKITYSKADITNTADNKIRTNLDDGDVWIEKRRDKEAVSHFQALVTKYPQSPRANFGLAEALCMQAEVKQSNNLLENCITQYLKVLDLTDVPKALMLKAGRACVSRQQFRGWGHKATKVLKRLISMYPEELELWNEMGVQNLMVGRSADARLAFDEVLRHDPENPYALAHVGFIIKTSDNNPEGAIPYLRKALSTGSEKVRDGRFFFHLGDALQRAGNVTEAHNWYTKGSDLGLFRSMWQRSLYNVDHLDSNPWWTHEQTKQKKLIKTLEDNWQLIRDEGLANMDASGVFKLEDENLREKGEWKQLTLFQQGRKNEENCKRAPKTCALIEKFPEAAACKRGQVKYSIMQPGVHVWPHCGPTNCRIRAHLGLVIPDNCCRIRVAEDIRTWQEGKVIIFDDSFEHEVWHEGDSFRLVLIIDIWHPDLTQREKTTLSPI